MQTRFVKPTWTGKKVVVTGGCGMIGSHLIDELVYRGCTNIVVYDDLSRGSLRNIWPQVNKGFIEHYDFDLAGITPPFPPHADAVFHLAAMVASISWNIANSLTMLQKNLAINWHVSEAVRIAQPKLYQYTSTACIYGHDVPVPTPESCGDICDCEPTNWGYGISKWVGEAQAKLIYREHGIPTIITRFFNAISPARDYYDEATSHVAPAIIKRVVDGEDPVRVWGTGNQSRVLVDARDIARCLVDLAERSAAQDAQPINIGHEKEITIGDLTRLICDLAGRENAEIVFDTSRPDGYPRRAADTTRLRALIGYVPNTPLAETLNAMIAEYRGKGK